MALRDRISALMNNELTAGRAVPTAQGLENERSAMVHEGLARLDFVLEHLNFRDKSVLDLGCGTGYAAQYVMSSGPKEIVGVDPSPASIRYAKEHYPAHTFVCMDASELDLHRKFDIVMAFEVIEHVRDPVRFLSTAVKHLSDSGVLALSTPNRLLFSLGREGGERAGEPPLPGALGVVRTTPPTRHAARAASPAAPPRRSFRRDPPPRRPED